jgi:predicted nucleotidyltransferase
MKLDIQYLKDNNLIIFESISGSTAYGLAREGKSDLDIRGVYISPLRNLLGTSYVDSLKKNSSVEQFLNSFKDDAKAQKFFTKYNSEELSYLIESVFGQNYDEQVSDDTNDTMYYEVGKFLKLIQKNNPNILELLNMPDEFVKYKHPVYDLILEHKDKFITKKCKNSFIDYAYSQLKKARGGNKKVVQKVGKIKKTPLDFCFVLIDGKSKKLKDYLKTNNLEQKFAGLVKIKNARDVYGCYYDRLAHDLFSKYGNKAGQKVKIASRKKNDLPCGFKFKGIINDTSKDSNDIRLSSIPKNIEKESFLCNIIYNKDGYTKYCNVYTDYWKWVEDRNEQRYIDNVANGYKGYDLKNAMHSVRLTRMAEEILDGKGIIVNRKNDRDYLLSIREGKISYEDLIKTVEDSIANLGEKFMKSTLPESVDNKLIDEILYNIRMSFYNINVL